MLKQSTDAVSQSFRHQQSQSLSHVFEPCELPVSKSRFKNGSLPHHHSRKRKTESQTKTRSWTVGELRADENPVRSSRVQKHSTDTLQIYFNEALHWPLLSKSEEFELTRKISRFRESFQRAALKDISVIEYFIELLGQLSRKQIRLDMVCNLGLSEKAKRAQVEPRIVPAIRKLKRIMKELNSGATPAEQKKLQRETVRTIEPLMIRPHRFEVAPFSNSTARLRLARYYQACHRLVQSNLRLVVKAARQFCHVAAILPDMIQEGNCGLLHAITKFNHRANVRFSTYATPWIKQYILSAMPNAQRNIRVTENFRAVNRKIQNQINRLQAADGERFEMGRRDTGESIGLIAEATGMEALEIARHMRMFSDTVSINQANENANHEGATDLADMLVDGQPSPDVMAESTENDSRVRAAMAQVLTNREHQVVVLRFGFDDGQAKSLAEVGREMGLTRQRVCQVQSEALAKLEKLIEAVAG